MNLLKRFWNEEHGFVVSAELVLIASIVILALVVGLAEVSHAVNHELEDVASAFGSLNQTFSYNGQCGHFANVSGTAGRLDRIDFCDGPNDIVSTRPSAEGQR